MQQQYRQGDVLIIATNEEVPEAAKPVKRDHGRLILAYGETTGHAHAICERGVKLLETTPELRWIVADEPFTLDHEEHAPIALPAGTFKVVYQREYVAPEIERRVID